MSAWKVILAALVIYAAGVFTGGFAVKHTQTAPVRLPSGPVFPGSDIFQQRFLERMKRELLLTPEQIKRLQTVFRESRERMKTLWEIVGPEMNAELRDVREKIRSELTPEQREKFEVLLKARRHPTGPAGSGDNRPREHRSDRPRSPQPGKSPAEKPAPSPSQP